ncbi:MULTISPECIES: ABC transporter permease [unclassified Paenibacillus]|uniref:ABC transporter permease n=1 Tax=unclassified Paenibacillus TaxID=185978 RepID=UPI0027896034|nr:MULTISPECIES: ABC transporter permease subunit [unclassified Paenibacillus]MDQ0898997.1 ABC-2 type transport system permease protein [Paenibacillus sp. V4I7]MDQ0915017.1 ABC-2 type transport system permease protein [Paenibacillus sp. V4I5]
MNHLNVLMKKEFVQMWREFKVIWLPLVFIFLGVTQPVVSHYLPSILKTLGGAQGITIDPSMAAQQGGEVLASTLAAQFDQLGVIIIAISMMGVLQTDKANGMLAFILTRPVAIISYIGGKIIANYIFVACSVVLGYLISYVYVNLLFTNVNFVDVIIASLFYLLWVLFMVTFTTMISTIFNSQGIIALISIVFLLGCRIVLGLSTLTDFMNPASMSKHAMEVLITGAVNPNVIWNGLVVLIWIVLTIIVTIFWISSKKFNNE